MAGTEARRVETEDANDARLDSRLREIPERFLSGRQIGVERRNWMPKRIFDIAKTHCAREFFLEEEGEWIEPPSSPVEPRETICLP